MAKSTARLASLLLSGAARAVDVPLYCGSVTAGARLLQQQPLLQDLDIDVNYSMPLVGNLTLSLAEVVLEKVDVLDCDATVADGMVNVKVEKLQMDIESFRFSYKQQFWPFQNNSANATGNLSASGFLALDMPQASERHLDFRINSLNLKLDSDKHKWLYSAAIWLGNHAQPVLGLAVQHELRVHVKAAMAHVRQDGACAEVNNILGDLSALHLEVSDESPFRTQVPLLGDVDFFVNASDFRLPKSVKCGAFTFNGTFLSAEFSELSLATDFQWRYRRAEGRHPGEFWHNAGNGSLSANASFTVKLDFLRPSQAEVLVHLPGVHVHLQSEAHQWLYDVIERVFPPAVQKAVEEFGGWIIRRKIECLADPACYLKRGARQEAAVELLV